MSPSKGGGSWFQLGPGLEDVIAEPEIKPYMSQLNATMPDHLYQRVKKQFVVVCFAIDTAAEVLMV